MSLNHILSDQVLCLFLNFLFISLADLSAPVSTLCGPNYFTFIKNLNTSGMHLPTFVFLKHVWNIFGPIRFQITLGIRLSSFTKKSVGLLIENILNV